MSDSTKPQGRPDTKRAYDLKNKARRQGVGSEADIVPGVAEHMGTRAMLREADAKLVVADPPDLGTGNEAVPTGDRATALPGLVETLKSPTHVHMNASEERAELLSRVGAWDIGLDMADGISAVDPMTKALAHQMGALHVKGMELLVRADDLFAKADLLAHPDAQAHYIGLATKLTNAADRLLGRYQQAMVTLHKVRHGNQQTVNVVHQHVNVEADRVAITGAISTGGQREGDDGGK